LLAINIGKQIWSSTKNKTSVQNALTHWNNHKSEFPELLNAKQYVKRSKNFFQNTNGVLTKIRSNGDILLYHKESNIFGVFTKKGLNLPTDEKPGKLHEDFI
jgi:pyocin large subunit-like protein